MHIYIYIITTDITDINNICNNINILLFTQQYYDFFEKNREISFKKFPYRKHISLL